MYLQLILLTLYPLMTRSSPCSAPGDPALALQLCPSNYNCEDLDMGTCLRCDCPDECHYGSVARANCTLIDENIRCFGEKTFTKDFTCQYCFQSQAQEALKCDENFECNAVSPDKAHYTANCSVIDKDMLCLGRRMFLKRRRCNWTSGYKWSTALAYSVTLGGFGADRFYLGHWQEGIGKLFSFGGLGVWTLVDVVMIGVGYVGPADGSLYV